MIFDDYKKNRAIELHEQGLSTKVIAYRLGVSYPTIFRFFQNLGLKPIAVCDG